MSVADELRDGVNKKIEEPKTKTEPVKTQSSERTSRPSPSKEQTASQPQRISDEQQPETRPYQTTEAETRSSNNNRRYGADDGSDDTDEESTGAIEEETPETIEINAAAAEEEKKKEREKAKTISDKNIRKLFDPDYDPTAPDEDDTKVGETGTTYDHDQKTDVNTDPIKVQKGDFIDFLMEDVVLNGFVGWSCGKVAGLAGGITYEIAEFGYHKTMRDPYRWGKKKWNEYKEKRDKERVEELKKAAKNRAAEEDLTPHENDSERAKFIKKLLRHHNSNLDAIEGLTSKYSIDYLAKKIEEGKLENTTFEKLSPELNASLQKSFAELKKLAPEDKEEALEYLKENLKESLLKEQQVACLASAYAASRMMNAKNKDKNYKNGASDEQINQEYQLLYLNARKQILENMKNENFSMDKLIENVGTAFDTELNNHKKLDKIEKNNSNETFDVKNSVLDKMRPQYGSQETDETIEEQLKEAKDKCTLLESDLRHIDSSRAAVKKLKDALQAGTPLHSAVSINDNEKDINNGQKNTKTSFMNAKGDNISLSSSNNQSINMTAKDKNGNSAIPSINDFEVVFNGLRNKRTEFAIGNISNDEFKARMIIAASNTGTKITNLDKRGAVNHAALSPETKAILQQKNIKLPQRQQAQEQKGR